MSLSDLVEMLKTVFAISCELVIRYQYPPFSAQELTSQILTQGSTIIKWQSQHMNAIFPILNPVFVP